MFRTWWKRTINRKDKNRNFLRLASGLDHCKATRGPGLNPAPGSYFCKGRPAQRSLDSLQPGGGRLVEG